MNMAMWLAVGVAVLMFGANVLPLLKRVQKEPAAADEKPVADNDGFRAEVSRIIKTAGDGMTCEFKLKHLLLGSTDAAIKDDVIAVLQEQLKAKKAEPKA